MIAIGSAPLFTMMIADRLEDVGNGEVIAVRLDGTVISVQPDGAIETRPAGTKGPYERATVIGNTLIYRPLDVAFAFAFAAKVRG